MTTTYRLTANDLTMDFLKALKVLYKGKNISITVEDEKEAPLAPLTAADWVQPGRPATEEEIELMLNECEVGIAISTEESRKNNLKKFKAWKQKSLK